MCDCFPITMWVYYGVTIIYSNKSWIISQDVPHKKKDPRNLCTCEVNGSMVRLLGEQAVPCATTLQTSAR